MLLEVQLCRRSKNGVVIPIARDDSPELVRYVAEAMLKDMADWYFQDELLDGLVEAQRKELERVLEELEKDA